MSRRYTTALDLSSDLLNWAQPRPSRASLYALIVLGLALIALIPFALPSSSEAPTTLGAPTSTNPQKAPDAVETEPQSFPTVLKTGSKYALFRYRPRLLDWRYGEEEVLLRHQPLEEKLTIVANKPVLVQLAEVQRLGYRLEIELECHNWNDRVALFWGHHQDPNDPKRASYQLLDLVRWTEPSGDKYYLYRRKVRDLRDAAGKPRSSYDAMSEPLTKAPNGRHKLSLTVTEKGLQTVQWDSQVLTKLTTDVINEKFPEEYHRGTLGLLVHKTTVFARNAKLTLLPDGSIPAPQP